MLKGNALEQIQKYADLYDKKLDDFVAAYNNLLSEKDILSKWKQEDKANKIGSTVDIMKEKKAIIGHFFDIQKVLFTFERAYRKLAMLKVYHDQGFGVGSLKNGTSTSQFFTNMKNDGIDIIIAKIRYIYKLYAKRNDGTVPASEFSSDIMGGDSAFGDSDSFFDETSDFFD